MSEDSKGHLTIERSCRCARTGNLELSILRERGQNADQELEIDRDLSPSKAIVKAEALCSCKMTSITILNDCWVALKTAGRLERSHKARRQENAVLFLEKTTLTC